MKNLTIRNLSKTYFDLHAGEGQGLDALLNKLVRLKASEPA